MIKKDLRYDALAAAITEVSLVFAPSTGHRHHLGADHLGSVVGMGRAADVDADLLADFRRLPDAAPRRRGTHQRARLSAVVSVFGDGRRVVRLQGDRVVSAPAASGAGAQLPDGEGRIDPALEEPAYWNVLAMLCFAIMLVMVRMRQETASREIDSLRRLAHSY